MSWSCNIVELDQYLNVFGVSSENYYIIGGIMHALEEKGEQSIEEFRVINGLLNNFELLLIAL